MVCDPGETIITPAPYWPMFSLLLAKAEVVVYVIPAVTQESENALNPADIDTLLNWSEETQKTWESHLRELEGRPRGRPKALLLSNPQNPLGRCYSKGYLEGALRFCQKYDLFLISDEVFGLSVYSDSKASLPNFTSILSVDLQDICDPQRVIVLWSVSKDLGASGTRVAFSIIPKELPDLRNTLMSIAPSFRVSSIADNFFSEFFTAPISSLPCSSFGSYIPEKNTRSLFAWYVSTNRQQLCKAKQQLQDWCDQHELKYLDSNAGNFLNINLESVIRRRPSNDDMDLEKSFHAHLFSEGVALQPGYSTMFPGFGWARVTFSRRNSYMKEGLLRLSRAIRSWG